MSRQPKRDIAIGLSVALVAFVVFYVSPIQQITDAKFTMLLSEQLLVKRSFALDEHFWPQAERQFQPGMRPNEKWPRQIQPGGRVFAERRGTTEGPLYYIFPHGPAVLSIPITAVCRWAGISTIRPGGGYDPIGAGKMHRIGAALLMACACALFFLTARLLLPPDWSLLIALAAGFGTQIWSSVSRAIRSQTWSVLLLAIACWLLLRTDVRQHRLRPLLLATLLSWGFFARPTAVLYIIPLTLYVLVAHRRKLPTLLAGGAFWLASFLAYSQQIFGTWLPQYYYRPHAFNLDGFVSRLAGQLISPSRGLLVFVPLVLLVAYLLVAYRAELRHRLLALAAGVAIVLHLLVTGSFGYWWGGHSYGPRLSADIVPLFCLLAVLGIRALLDREARGGSGGRTLLRKRLEGAALVTGLALGMLLNGAGAQSAAGDDWNWRPVSINADPLRAFDWRHSQGLCALYPPLLPKPAGVHWDGGESSRLREDRADKRRQKRSQRRDKSKQQP